MKKMYKGVRETEKRVREGKKRWERKGEKKEREYKLRAM